MRSCTGVDRAGLVLLLAALLCPDPRAEAKIGSYGPFPRPDTGYVTDSAGLLARAQGRRLESRPLQTQKRSGVKALSKEFGGQGSVPRWLFWAIGGALVLLIPVAISLFRNGKRGWGWVVLSLILVLLLALIWLGRRVAETISDGGPEPGGPGGFGGGFSGGGGATGSW